jgi:hypothetical protein
MLRRRTNHAHSNSSTRTHISTMATLISDKFALVKASF